MMEQVIDVAAQTLPNLMSMLGMFIQERRHQKGLTHQEFLEWLDTHRFEELKRVVMDTHGLEREIDLLLKAQQGEILNELKVISQSVGLIASRMDLIGGVSQRVSPRIKLSDQALWLLKKLNVAESFYPFMNIMHYSQGILVHIGARHHELKAARFIRDDFRDLLSVGFIAKHSTNNDGEPVFGITRLGAEFVELAPDGPDMETSSLEIG